MSVCQCGASYSQPSGMQMHKRAYPDHQIDARATRLQAKMRKVREREEREARMREYGR